MTTALQLLDEATSGAAVGAPLDRRVRPHWWLTKDGDRDCLEMYLRHYSAYHYADQRERKLFVGPGEKVVLRTERGDAFFVWRKFVDDCIDQRTGQRQRARQRCQARAGGQVAKIGSKNSDVQVQAGRS